MLVETRGTITRPTGEDYGITAVSVPVTFTHPGDPATDEAFLSLMDSLGATAVPLDDVARLVTAGVDVWSYGYGWDDDDDGFTTLDDDDRWAFEDADYDVIASWGPFYAAVR